MFSWDLLNPSLVSFCNQDKYKCFYLVNDTELTKLEDNEEEKDIRKLK